jgi:hypothetical protein
MQSALASPAIKQTFGRLNIKTEASDKLKRAEIVFHANDLTRSTRLFLESCCILQNEYKNRFYEQFDSSFKEKQFQQQVRENQERILLSFAALHDFAQVCSRNHEKYKNKSGECKLETYASQDG